MLDILKLALIYIVPFLFVLTLIVTIHELGHFWAARAFGVAVDRFSIGFGKAIVHWTDKHGVEWRIGWIPLGGYVRFAGDENEASVPDPDNLAAMRRSIVAREGEGGLDRYFHFKPLWQRAIVVAAGPIANFILAITVFSALLMIFGQQITPARVDGVKPGTPAERAGFKPGDVVLSADGRIIESFDRLSQYVMLRSDTPIDFVVDRRGREVALTATPARTVIRDRFGNDQQLGALGLEGQRRPGDVITKRYNPGEAVVAGTAKTYDVLASTLFYVGRMVTGRETADQIGGPLRMAQVSGSLTKEVADAASGPGSLIVGGFFTLLQLAAILSVGIGFLNLLPIPVLDGGHLLFYAYEAVARRPLAANVQAAGYRVGLALVLGLMLFATWNDLQQLHVFTNLGKP